MRLRLSLGVLMLAGASHAAEGPAFFLDGKAITPALVVAAGASPHPGPGDVVEIAGLPLLLREAPEYRFRAVPEGLRLKSPDGQARLVGARVVPSYEADGPELIDGLKALSKAEVRGLWGLEAQVWNASCAKKAAWLDVARVYLVVGQSAIKTGQDLPELPAGLRHLYAGHFLGWRSLTRLQSLESLSLMPEETLDLRLLGGLSRLKRLRVLGGKLEHVEALAGLGALESLDLNFAGEVADLGFARALLQLRELHVTHTRVSDLAPLAGLDRLEAIEAHGAPVAVLPDSPLPALRRLDVIATKLRDEQVAAFRQAHPLVRVRHRWNDSLREALAGITRLRLGPGELCSGSGACPPYETSDPAEIAEAMRLLTVDEERSGPVCACYGSPRFEFYRGELLAENATLVCDHMLAWRGWPGHGVLLDPNLAGLREWLAQRGFTGPRDAARASVAAFEADERKQARATAGMSSALREAWKQAILNATRAPAPEAETHASFADVLARELPAVSDRVRALLRVLGAGNDSFQVFDWPEQLADQLLRTYPREELEPSCEAALLGDDRRVRRGAARLWAASESPLATWRPAREAELRGAFLDVLQESRHAEVRARSLASLFAWWAELPQQARQERLSAAMRDPDDGVRRKAMLLAAQAGIASSEGFLIQVLAGERVEPLALPAVPADEELDLNPQADVFEAKASDAEVAALGLGYLKSERALTLLEERRSSSAMFRVARALVGERCDLLAADDFHTEDRNQALQLAAVEAVVRCRGRHGLELALGYRQVSHWWEPERVTTALRQMLLAADAPGRGTLAAATTLPQLRDWYKRYGAAYLRRVGATAGGRAQ